MADPSDKFPSTQMSSQLITTQSSTPVSKFIPAASRTHPMTTRSQNNIFQPKQVHSITKHPLPSFVEPSCATQTIKDPLWKQAMLDKIQELHQNQTWKLVPYLPNRPVVGCKWVF